jgi:hypothetical protein
VTNRNLELKVCWGPKAAGNAILAEVGKLMTFRPRRMTKAISTLTSVIEGTISPMVIEFQTDRSYQLDPLADVSLRILATNFLHLPIYKIDTTEVEVDVDVDEKHEATQGKCGEVFMELWSDHEDGYPRPRGCYIKFVPNTNLWEIGIVFEPGRPPVPGSLFRMVVNSELRSGVRADKPEDEAYIQVLLMDGIMRPYEVLELGAAHMTQTVKMLAPLTGVRFNSAEGGFRIVSNNGGDVAQVDVDNPLVVDIYTEPTVARIPWGTFLQLFLWPLTAWDVGRECVVTCRANDLGRYCGDISLCEGFPLHRGMNRNNIMMRFPLEMDDIFGPYSMRLTFRLDLPAAGIFPSRLGAQLLRSPDKTRGMYQLSSAAWMFVPPAEQLGNGNVVRPLRPDIYAGNKAPFSDEVNVLFLRLQVPARIAAGPGLMSQVRIHMPPGYECVDQSPVPRTLPGVGDLPGDFKVELVDRGQSGQGGCRSCRDFLPGAACTLGLFEGETVFAKQVVYTSLKVRNSELALPASDPQNRWTLEIITPGDGPWENLTVSSTHGFSNHRTFKAPGGEVKLANNVAVVGLLKTEIFPTSLLRSQENMVRIVIHPQLEGTWHLAIFVHGGYVIDGCNSIMDLPGPAYSPRHAHSGLVVEGEPLSRMHYDIAECTAGNASWSDLELLDRRAGIYADRLDLPLQAPLQTKAYGFALHVNNPCREDPDRFGWRILTFSKFGLLIEGTRTPMPYQGRDHFPIFDIDLPTDGAIEGIPPDLTFSTDPDTGLRVAHRDQSKFPRRVGFYIESMLPSAWNTGNFTMLRVYPIRVPRPVNATLRLIPPDGYLFGMVDGNPPESTAPLGTAMDSGSGLTYAAGPFFPNEIYAINAEVFIPMEDLAKGSPGWYLEFGYEAPDEINVTAPPPDCEKKTGKSRTNSWGGFLQRNLGRKYDCESPRGATGICCSRRCAPDTHYNGWRGSLLDEYRVQACPA